MTAPDTEWLDAMAGDIGDSTMIERDGRRFIVTVTELEGTA